MEVHITHHLESSKLNAQEQHDFSYEYDLYFFSKAKTTIVARSYVTETNEVHFLRIESDGQSRLLIKTDLKSPLFIEAVYYLQKVGKETLNWLSGRGNGYEPIRLKNSAWPG